MGENSKIQWTDHTFNGWVGCEKVSEACKFCYAETYATRWSIAKWGKNGTRHLTADTTWNKLDRWNRLAMKEGVRRRVFCFSLADIFEDSPLIKQEWRDRFWSKAKELWWLDLLCLTKRPENIMKFLPQDWSAELYANVWFGTSIENQQRYNERAHLLSAVPAARRFYSIEPMLGEITLNIQNKVDWIILGGESGFLKDARPLDLRLVDRLFKQVEIFNGKGPKIHLFFKQTGSRLASVHKMKRDNKGGNFDDYPMHLDWLKVREVPAPAIITETFKINGKPISVGRSGITAIEFVFPPLP